MGQMKDQDFFIGGREFYLLIYLLNGSIASSNIAWEAQIGQIKKMNCFSGTAAPVLKALHYYFFYCFLKIKMNTFQVS